MVAKIKTKPNPKTVLKNPSVKPKQKASIKKTAVKTVKPKDKLIRESLEKSGAITIDLCEVKLTNTQLEFIINYVTPCQPCFQNALQSAIKAGYSESAAKTGIYGFIQRPDIQKIIRANEHLINNAIHSAALRALEIKIERAFYDIKDYYEEKEITVKNKKGQFKKKVIELKNLKDMTPAQRLCIDGVDAKGMSGVMVYILPDRGRELNEIIKIDHDISKSVTDDGEDETMQIIMERLTVSQTRRREKDEISRLAGGFIRAPKGEPALES